MIKIKCNRVEPSSHPVFYYYLLLMIIKTQRNQFDFSGEKLLIVRKKRLEKQIFHKVHRDSDSKNLKNNHFAINCLILTPI